MKNIKVKDHIGLVRDRNTGAILNVDRDAIRLAREKKLRRLEEKAELESLRNDVSDMKQLLNQIVDKLNGS